MSAPLSPKTVPELIEVVRASKRILAVGANTKPRLSKVDGTTVSLTQLQGIVEYEPSEFTFTALAGTPLKDLAAALAKRGQYLPFDPFFVQSGATLGGTVAAGLSGPGRARFGGLKDFILGTHFIDGLGRQLRVGGKVVKNAAGFDLPKFFVGSLGRFGILTELTFKVFPAPAATLTLRLQGKDIEAASGILVEAGSGRWEVDALDIIPGGCDIGLRLAGPPQALEQIADEILGRWPGEKLSQAEAERLWSELKEGQWAYANGLLIKVVLTPALLPALYRELKSFEPARLHVSGGGTMALISLPSDEISPQSRGSIADPSRAMLDPVFRRLGLSALTLRGDIPLWLGSQSRAAITQAVKAALDPENRFPGLDE